MKFSFLLYFLFFSFFANAQNLKEPVSIPFELSPNGHIMIKARINNVEGNFIFDTGAGVHLLTKKFADTIKTLAPTHHFYTGHRATGEALETDLWIARSLDLGTFHLENQTVAVYDIKFPLDGIISLSSFTDRAITIDFKQQQLVVETESSLRAREQAASFQMPLQITNVRDIDVSISTPIIINDSLELNVSLDSGAGFAVYRFNERYMEALGVDTAKVNSEFKPSYFKPKDGNMYYSTTLASLSDADKHIFKKDFKATFIEGLLYEGIMGINWIGEVLTFDIANKRLLVE